MTETEAKKILFKHLEKTTRPEFPHVWIGNVVYTTPQVYIIEGTIYSEKDNPEEIAMFCAVDKKTGKSGMILPPPGPELTAASFKNFRWEDWLIA